jgi:hypothetical protein
MKIELNHTIVHASDGQVAAEFLAELFGLPPPKPFGPFLVVQTTNGVSLDYISTDEPMLIEHYAFLVGEEEFDRIFDKIKQRNIMYWADPAAKRPNEINTNDGGHGLYFKDPSGHYMEIITRPYGG